MSDPYVIRLSGDLELFGFGESAAALDELPSGARLVVVDLSEVTGIDSGAMTALLRTFQR